MMDFESDEHAQQPQKRSRKSNSGEDAAGGKKARGRPRVDTQDATAADRRRTQIRLAQRAYRQRKETTIVSLKQQSAQLHSIIEQMNKNFNHLAESTLNSGLLQLNSGLAQEFKTVKETFSSLAKTASEAQYELDEDGEHGVEKTERQKPCDPEPEPDHVGWGYSTVPQVPSKDPSQQNLAVPNTHFSYASSTGGPAAPNTPIGILSSQQFTFGEISGHNQHFSEPLSNASSSQQTLPFGLVPLPSQGQSYTPNTHVYTVRVPTPGAYSLTNGSPNASFPIPSLSNMTLSPIATYSYEETSFARRLARKTAEAALQILTSFQVSPAIVNFIFRLTLPYCTVEQLQKRFQNILAQGTDEDLDWWDAPFLHVGGAGTHYPRRDAAGNVIPMKDRWTIDKIGPIQKKLNRVKDEVDMREHFGQMDLEMEGFEGEWFDCQDVQGYLEDRYACKIDHKSSFAECLIDIEDYERANPHTSTSQQPPGSGTTDSGTSHGFTHPSASCTSAAAHASETPYNTDANHTFGLDMPIGHTPEPEFHGDFPKLVDHDISFDQTLGLDLAPSFEYGLSSNNGFSTDAGLGMMAENLEDLQVVRQSRKRRAWLDVAKLIDELITSAVCLGRTPGFRPKDIDSAVKAALIKEY